MYMGWTPELFPDYLDELRTVANRARAYLTMLPTLPGSSALKTTTSEKLLESSWLRCQIIDTLTDDPMRYWLTLDACDQLSENLESATLWPTEEPMPTECGIIGFHRYPLLQDIEAIGWICSGDLLTVVGLSRCLTTRPQPISDVHTKILEIDPTFPLPEEHLFESRLVAPMVITIDLTTSLNAADFAGKHQRAEVLHALARAWKLMRMDVFHQVNVKENYIRNDRVYLSGARNGEVLPVSVLDLDRQWMEELREIGSLE